MKKISQHLGQIILAVAAVALIIGVVLTFGTPVANFFNGIFDKTNDMATGGIWDIPYSVKLTSNMPEAGTIEFTSEGHSGTSATVKGEQTLTFKATLNDGYEFLGWYNGETLISEDLEYTEGYMVTGKTTITAKYEENRVYVDEATGEILDSWEQIIASVNDGSYATKYAVGNYKPLDLGSEGVVNMQIAALDTDVLSDGSGNAHITWIAKELLATRRSTSANGWASSAMRTYLHNDVWALIPTEIQNAIVEVNKTYYDNATKSTLTCADKVWIPSYREVGFGVDKEDSGVIYSELFANTSDRNKADIWWLRSAYSTYNVYIVNGAGIVSYNDTQSSFGVVLCFCM